MRNWKLGSISAGVILICIGLLWFLQNFISIPFNKILLSAWPVACILLGIEILINNVIKRDDPLRIHWLSIFLLMLVIVVSLGFNFGNMFFKEFGMNLQTNNVNIQNEKEIPKNVKEVVIEGPDVDLNLIGSENNRIGINGSVSIPSKSKKEAIERLPNYYSVSIQGDKLYIRIKDDNHFISFHDSNSILNVEVPKNLQSNVNVDYGSIDLKNLENTAVLQTDDGDITIEDFKGELNATSDHGSINLSHALLNQNSKFNTDDGDITIKDLKGDLSGTTSHGTITLNKIELASKGSFMTDDGEITIDDLKGAISANSNHGTITINHADINDDSIATTDDGEIHINLVGSPDLNIKADTDDGTIDGNIKWKMKNKEEENKREAILGSGNYMLRLHSSHGDITVNRK